MNASVHDFLSQPGAKRKGPDRPKVETHQKVQTLRELATFQLAHGSVRWADDLTQIALMIDPGDLACLRLRAHTLSRLGRAGEGLKLLLHVKRADRRAVTLDDFVAVGLALARFGDLRHAKTILFKGRS